MMMRVRYIPMLALLAVTSATPGVSQVALQQPFTPGESLTYRARIGSVAGGTGEMRVDRSEAIRGREVYLLRFDFRGGAGPIRMSGQSSSWLDPETMTAMRFHKQERSPLGSSSERVELFPAQGIWRSDDGQEGSMPTRLPLDELSYLFYIRTLPLTPGAVYTSQRHFDRRRTPVMIRVVGRERIHVPAGDFSTIVVEMRVPDGQHVGEGGLIRLHLTDDAWRVPVRIESSVRMLGTVVFSLVSSNRHTGSVAASR